MPRRYIHKNTTAPPSLPPPPEMNSAAFQAVVSTAVTATLAHINQGTNGRGNGNGVGSSNHGNNHAHQRTCTYKDFKNAKSKSFNESGGVISLTWWIEKTDSVFEICRCPYESKVRFAACTFAGKAHSWWNGHIKALTLPVLNAMSWKAQNYDVG